MNRSKFTTENAHGVLVDQNRKLDVPRRSHKFICKKLQQFATANSTFEIIISNVHHRITQMYINFQQNRVSRSVNTIHTNLFANNRKLHKFATTNSNFEKKSIISDMHHRVMYMYIYFQQIRVSGSVKTVLTNIFANKRKLHKFATTNSNLEIINYFRHASS